MSPKVLAISLASGLTLTTSSTASAQSVVLTETAVNSSAEPYSPENRPSNWPFSVVFTVCSAWASPRGEKDYYRESKDRPFAVGTTSSAVWQIQQALKYVPEAVMVVDILPNVPQGPEKAVAKFAEYLDAAQHVPGSRIMPMLDTVLPQTAKDEAKEQLTYEFCKLMLQRHGRNPHWFNINGIPVMNDYNNGGLGVEAIGRITAKLKTDGFKLLWFTDAGSNIQFALDGIVDPKKLNSALENTSGVYSFIPPTATAKGEGFERMAGLVRAYPQPRIFGVSTAVGHYSARLSQRNLVAADGTAHFRESLDLALKTRADLISPQTWSDYVENAHVEPSYKHTSALLEIIRHYTDLRSNRAHQTDTQPHLIASYRKALFPGETLDIELLNLPVGQPFGILEGDVVLRDQKGLGLARLPFSLNGGRPDVRNLKWRIPSTWHQEMLDVQLEIRSQSGRAWKRHYRNLPPIPVSSDGQLADPLSFHVPLHRLYNDTVVETAVNGSTQIGIAPYPRLLKVKPTSSQSKIPTIAGVSYLRSGAIINDPVPVTATSAVLDNYAEDRTRFSAVPADYYGALVQFTDGRLAYARGQWCQNPSATRVWADYRFQPDVMYYNKEQFDPGRKLWDKSGNGFHGTPAQKAKDAQGKPSGKVPSWTPLQVLTQVDTPSRSHNIQPLWAALSFDGESGAVDLPGVRGFPAGPMTVELLLRPAQVDRAQALVVQGGENINLLIDAGGRIRARHTNSHRQFDDIVSQTALKPGQWATVIATYDMSTLRLYINGRLEKEISTDGLRPNEGARFGAPFWGNGDPRRGPWGYFKGDLAHFRILQGASAANEIARESKNLLAVAGEVREATSSK